MRRATVFGDGRVDGELVGCGEASEVGDGRDGVIGWERDLKRDGVFGADDGVNLGIGGGALGGGLGKEERGPCSERR